MFKKTIIFLLMIFLFLTLIGCSNSDNTNEETSQEEDVLEEVAAERFTYTYNGTEIKLNSKAQPILDSLGEEISYFESESCAFPGLDKVYTYPGLEIQTYEKAGVDHILSVNIIDDTIVTGKDVRLFDSFSKVKDAYGENYEEKAGQYIYTKGNTKLSFLVKDDEVIAIEYAVIIEDME
jgi:hypothetical protein